MMLSAAQEFAVMAELSRQDRLSCRKIAGLTGVSRGTVANIANGSRPLRHPGIDLGPLELPVSIEAETTVPPRRCDGCGGTIVVIPCRLCACRRRIAERGAGSTERGAKSKEQRAKSEERVPAAFFDPEFHDDQNCTAAEKRATYEAIRKAKEAEGEEPQCDAAPPAADESALFRAA